MRSKCTHAVPPVQSIQWPSVQQQRRGSGPAPPHGDIAGCSFAPLVCYATGETLREGRWPCITQGMVRKHCEYGGKRGSYYEISPIHHVVRYWNMSIEPAAVGGHQTVTAGVRARMEERARAFFEVASECPVEAWLSVLGHRWCALVLYHLRFGPLRFTDLRNKLPTLSQKVLTDRLRELAERGLLLQSGRGAHKSYALTPAGQDLMPILDAIEVWSRANSVLHSKHVPW